MSSERSSRPSEAGLTRALGLRSAVRGFVLKAVLGAVRSLVPPSFVADPDGESTGGRPRRRAEPPVPQGQPLTATVPASPRERRPTYVYSSL